MLLIIGIQSNSQKVTVHEPEPQTQESENEAQTGESFDIIWCDLLVPVLFDFILLDLALPHSIFLSLRDCL